MFPYFCFMKYISSLIILFLFVNCSEKPTVKTTETVSKKENIVLIFGKRTFEKDTIYFNNGKSYSLKKNPILTYFENYPYERHEIKANNLNSSDTITIATKNQILLEHRYHYFYASNYVLKAGDTIQFDYKNDAPYARLLNNRKLDTVLNFEVNYNLANDIYVDDIEFREKHGRYRTKSEYDVYLEDLIKNRTKQLVVLDSLHSNGNFQKTNYNFQKNKLKYRINLMSDFSDIDKDKIELQNDSLLMLPLYKRFLSYYVTETLNIPIIKRKNVRIADKLILFDSIQNSDLFSKKIQHYLLFTTLKDIAKYYPLADFKSYHQKFTETVKDSTLLNLINDTYLTDFISLKGKTDDVYLTNTTKERTTLTEIIQQFKGKVVYVDFWASWCAPCRAAMKPAKKLRKTYENKDFVYIFISIDKDFSQWLKASNEENLKYFKNNYLSVNYPSAQYYRELQMKSIPRYIMYDTKGNMISKDAPSPKDAEIYEFIDQYIDK